MKILFPVLAVAMGMTFTAHASETETDNSSRIASQGWYVNVSAVKTEVDTKSRSIDLDASFALSLGYDFKISPKFLTGVEVEYIDYGTNTIGSTTAFTNTGNLVSADIDESLTAFNLVIRPKYYIHEGFYLGAMVGYGTVKYEQELTKTGYNSLDILDESENAALYGAEVGYEFNSGWLLRAGIRKTSPEFFNQEIDLTTSFIGLGYKF